MEIGYKGLLGIMVHNWYKNGLYDNKTMVHNWYTKIIFIYKINIYIFLFVFVDSMY